MANMEKQKFLDTLTEIGTCEDETKRRSLLAELNSEATALYDNHATLTKQNETLTADNETLRSANMKLFLQVGAQKTEQQRKHDQTGANTEEPEKKIKYDDLFNEKGELK